MAESPVAMSAAWEEPLIEVATAAAAAAALASSCSCLERRRWASCVRSLNPLRIDGLLCGLIFARGTVRHSRLMAQPVPFAIVVANASAAPGRVGDGVSR